MSKTGKRLPALLLPLFSSIFLDKRFLFKLLHSSSKIIMSNKKAFERLSRNVLPTNYALTFKPILEKFTFDGQADISIEVFQIIYS